MLDRRWGNRGKGRGAQDGKDETVDWNTQRTERQQLKHSEAFPWTLGEIAASMRLDGWMERGKEGGRVGAGRREGEREEE